ncbi:hypothetical protein RHS04_00368 [Rhizoctonia solani]|uniref:C2H2-type domain-containing protein n=1 Tax=Rhizoctonia solani TaxID=456999 RepID=A0A8H7IIS3_9AGAM|nr:hypothetical protein RHS04_00368 [Rhizoctonia solani]KAF8760364.1 hypothetical protein RHS01_01392 [Rhizoctonia solani]
MSSIRALLNVPSSSHSGNDHDLPSLTSLSTALLNYSSSADYPARYSDSSPSYSPPHSRESNSPPIASQAYYSSYSSSSSSYLPTPASSVRNLPLSSSTSSANGSPSYSADNSFSYPSPRSETATIGPSYLAQVTDSLSYPYSMSRVAPMMSQPPSPALPVSAPIQQQTPPQPQQAWGSMPPPPAPMQADDKELAKHDISSAPASPGSSAAAQAPAAPATAAQKAKKKHVCQTCSRPFSTSGHLARHTRVHTGERNHKCPFPGCETRCSRQDNLQQHYRIHLSPKSRRTSNSAATRAAIARAIESAVHDDITNSGVHASHPPAHPHPYPSYPPPHPHYAPTAPPYGAYPQYPPNGSAVHPGQPQFVPAPGQPHPMHYPYPPPMGYPYPPPGPGQLPVHPQGPPQAPPHIASHNGHPPQYAAYTPQRPPGGAPGYPTQSGQQTPMGAPGQSAAPSRAASTSGSNSPVQQSPRNSQAAPLPAANALGLQNGVAPAPASVKPGQWNVDQHGQPLGPDGRPHYANGAYAYPSPYPSEAGGGQPLPNTMPPSNQRSRPGAGMPSPQSPGRAMNGNASGPPTPSAYAPQQVIQLEPTAPGQQGDGRSPRPTLPPIAYRSPQVTTNQYPGAPNVPQQGGQVPVSNTRGRAA